MYVAIVLHAAIHTCHGAQRIKVRMLGYGCGAQCARAYLLLARLSLFGSLISLGYLLGLVAVDLPVAVRFDVARGTRGTRGITLYGLMLCECFLSLFD
jgi:hypothetical protein